MESNLPIILQFSIGKFWIPQNTNEFQTFSQPLPAPSSICSHTKNDLTNVISNEELLSLNAYEVWVKKWNNTWNLQEEYHFESSVKYWTRKMVEKERKKPWNRKEDNAPFCAFITCSSARYKDLTHYLLYISYVRVMQTWRHVRNSSCIIGFFVSFFPLFSLLPFSSSLRWDFCQKFSEYEVRSTYTKFRYFYGDWHWEKKRQRKKGEEEETSLN